MPLHAPDAYRELGCTNHDPKAWSVMDSWMNSCLVSHVNCVTLSKQKSYQPTRLLDLTSPGLYRLIQGTAWPSTPDYVALSYCWGESAPHTQLRLLESTEASLRSGKDVTGLPKTFQDAIEITRHFGVRYLWIDRLCIFQDSAEDWRNEASAMRHVYGNAHFTIAALSAQDAEAGMFCSRDPAGVTPPIINARPGTGERFRVLTGKEILSTDFLPWFLKDEPLMRRSWIVQELLLPVRTLFIGSRWNFWSCRGGQASEPFPSHYRAAASGEGSPLLSWNRLLGLPVDGHRMPVGAIMNEWDQAVRHYAERELSMPGDKLVAISGLAKDVLVALERAQPGMHRYLAGLWEKNILNGLLWQAKAPARRAICYRAPSWSWACVDGLLKTGQGFRNRHRSIIYNRLLDTSIEYLTDDYFGEVKSGTLTLTVLLASISINTETMSPRPYRQHIKDVRSIVAHGNNYEVETFNNLSNHNLIHLTSETPWVAFDTLADVVPNASLAWVRVTQLKITLWLGEGLVITCVDGTHYQRLGYMRASFDSESDVHGFADSLPKRDIKII